MKCSPFQLIELSVDNDETPVEPSLCVVSQCFVSILGLPFNNKLLPPTINLATMLSPVCSSSDLVVYSDNVSPKLSIVVYLDDTSERIPSFVIFIAESVSVIV